MSVCISYLLSCPLPMRIFKCWSQKGLVVDCVYILILIYKGEGAHLYILLFSYQFLYLINYLYYINRMGAVLLNYLRLDFFNLHWTAGLSHALRPTALHITALASTALCCTSLHYSTLHCTAHHCTELYWTALNCCTALQCTAYTALHCREKWGRRVDQWEAGI